MQNPQSRASAPMRAVHVLLGIITAACSAALLALLALWARSTEHPLLDLNLVLLILCALALFLAITSFRLLIGRGASKGGGLLSPAGYRVFGGLVFLVGMRVVWSMAPIEPRRAALLGVAFIVTGTMCFTLAWSGGRCASARRLL